LLECILSRAYVELQKEMKYEEVKKVYLL